MRNKRTIQIIGVLGFMTALPAHAYVDPGTGSMAVQMIIGGVVAAAFMIKTYYYQLKARVRTLFGRSKSAELQQAADETPNTDA